MTPEQRIQAQTAQRIQTNTAINNACRGEGFTPGTPGWRNCRLVAIQIIARHRALQQAQAAAATAHRRQALLAIGTALMQKNQRFVANCTTTRMGVFVNTNCY